MLKAKPLCIRSNLFDEEKKQKNDETNEAKSKMKGNQKNKNEDEEEEEESNEKLTGQPAQVISPLTHAHLSLEID